jgi:hypothetical protein
VRGPGMVSAMREHPVTANHPTLELGSMMSITGQLDTHGEMRKFIQGFQ